MQTSTVFGMNTVTFFEGISIVLIILGLLAFLSLIFTTTYAIISPAKGKRDGPSSRGSKSCLLLFLLAVALLGIGGGSFGVYYFQYLFHP